jgi:hypothetical protein
MRSHVLTHNAVALELKVLTADPSAALGMTRGEGVAQRRRVYAFRCSMRTKRATGTQSRVVIVDALQESGVVQRLKPSSWRLLVARLKPGPDTVPSDAFSCFDA